MGLSHRSSGKSKGKNPEIVIPKELVGELEALPNKYERRIVFTVQDDEIIKRYGKLKSLTSIAKIIGKNEKKVRLRYKELME
jgi:hypothetical protein